MNRNNCSAVPEGVEDLSPLASGSSPLVIGLSNFSIVVLILVVVLLLPILYIRKDRFFIIRERLNTTFWIMLFGCCFQICWAIDSSKGREGFPCSIINNLILLILHLQIFPEAIRIMSFYCRVRLNKQLAKFQLLNAIEFGVDSRIRDDNIHPSHSLLETKETSCCARWFSKFVEDEKDEEPFETQVQTKQSTKITSPSELSQKASPSYWLFLFASSRFEVGCTLILVLVTIGLFIPRYYEFAGCLSPCQRSDSGDVNSFITVGSLYCAISAYFMLQIRNEPDPLNIKQEYAMKTIVGIVFGIPFGVLLLKDPNGIEALGEFRWGLIWVFASILHLLILLGYPLYLSYKEEKLRGSNVLQMSLDQVLESATGRNLFKAFLVTEFSVENYLFWRDVQQYKSKFEKRNSAETEKIRKRLYDYYVDPDAPLVVNISGTSSTLIAGRMKDAPTPLDFDEAVEDVYANMRDDSFFRFRRTSGFKTLLGETLTVPTEEEI